MRIGESYSTSILVIRIDETKIPSVIKVMDQHPRIKRVIEEKGIYLYAEKADYIEHYEGEAIFRISVSIGDIEQDCFDIGYYEFSNNVSSKEIVEYIYNEKILNYTCERMINNYVPLRLHMPAPCEEALKTEYVSTDEEKVAITYISESMCHSIMRKLWNCSGFKMKDQEMWNVLAKEIGLTDDEFHALLDECEMTLDANMES